MGFFEDVYNKLFSKSQSNAKILHEVLERSDTFKSDYLKWMLESGLDDKLNSIRTSYELKKKGIEQNPIIHVLSSKYANGFAISFSDYFLKSDFAFLLEYFGKKTKELGYKLSNNDLTISDKGKYTQTIEKLYLKPIISAEPPIDQKYGNILIENVLIDDKPSYLKLHASIYSDSLYKNALSFEDYLAHILK